MPRYLTDVDRWISHECRMVKAGEEFETEFPKGMRLADTLHLVEAKPEPKAGKGKGNTEDLT